MILIYGKATCQKCVAAKEKMEILSIESRVIDLEAVPGDWRDLRVCEAMSLYLSHDDLPWIEVSPDLPLMSYAAAMKQIRRAP